MNVNQTQSKFTLVLLLGFLLLSACDRTPPLTPLKPHSVVLAFGDSLTYGTGVGSNKSYPYLLGKRLGVRVINSGVPGETTDAGLERLPGILKRYRPDLVILLHGSNDILRKLEPAQTKENLRQMIMQIHAVKAEVVLIAMPQIGIFPQAAPYYEELADEFHLPVELNIVTRLQYDENYKSDTVHFNEEGYAALTDAVFELLRKSKAIK